MLYFYPRSPCGERHGDAAVYAGRHEISIHALLAESDGRQARPTRKTCYFYPRSPCGERPAGRHYRERQGHISIHALLAESDAGRPYFVYKDIISIHALLAESDGQRRQTADGHRAISIHALLAESDVFLLRKITITVDISIHALLAESDVNEIPDQRQINQFLSTLSLRRATTTIITICTVLKFLSTLSLRRATALDLLGWLRVLISIHALLAESDPKQSIHHKSDQ